MAEIDQPRFHNDAISTSSAGVNIWNAVQENERKLGPSDAL
jgi:hypothetical protein